MYGIYLSCHEDQSWGTTDCQQCGLHMSNIREHWVVALFDLFQYTADDLEISPKCSKHEPEARRAVDVENEYPLLAPPSGP